MWEEVGGGRWEEGGGVGGGGEEVGGGRWEGWEGEGGGRGGRGEWERRQCGAGGGWEVGGTEPDRTDRHIIEGNRRQC